MYTTRILALGVFVLGAVACAQSGDDRIDNIHKLKILAVKAGQPDLLPGETTTVEVLVASPKNGAVSTAVIPLAHGQPDAGSTFTYAEGASHPAAPVTTSVVHAMLPSSATFYYTAPTTPGSYDLAALVRAGEAEGLDSAHALKALKTVRVRNAGVPLNENPQVDGVVMTKRWKIVENDRKVPLPAGGVHVEPGDVVRLEAKFTDEMPDRASVVWWLTAGEFEDYGRHDVDFIAPKKPGIVTVVALVLDRDNGAGWYVQDLAVGAGKLVPEVTGENPVLVTSQGRMVWLALGEQDRKTLATRVRAGESVSAAIEVVPDPEARLGWRAENAMVAAGAGMPAGEVSGTKAGKVLLAVDGIVSPLE